MQPERRKGIRILTIANVGRALLVLVLVVAAANIISEMRKPRPGEFGRLNRDPAPVAVKHPEVVTEAEVPDITPAGPSAALLSGVAPAPLPVQEPVMPAGEATGAPLKAALTDHVSIVGGADGIHVENTQRNATPKLSGGIFRQ
jgi:hypothetical protein